MEKSGVNELVGDELPNHPLGKSSTAQAEDAVREVSQRRRDAHKNKNENIDGDQRLDGGDLKPAISLKHAGNLGAGGGVVDARPDSHRATNAAHHAICHGRGFLRSIR